MKLYEIGTGYTPIPAQMGAATEIVVEGLTRAFQKLNVPVEIIDIKATGRADTDLPIQEVWVPACFSGTDVKLGLMHKLKRVVYSLCLTAKLRGILKNAEEQTVLHFHNQYNLFFFLKLTPAKLRAKARIAYTVHSYIWPEEWEKIEETVRKRYFQEIYCVQHADDVLVLNDKTAEHFVQRLGVAPERIHKIGNGVDTDAYHVLAQEEVDEFYKARKSGLNPEHLLDYYVWLINKDGTDGVWKGFNGELQQTQNAPYCVCQAHTEATWLAYQESLIPEETVPETVPGETLPDDPTAVG